MNALKALAATVLTVCVSLAGAAEEEAAALSARWRRAILSNDVAEMNAVLDARPEFVTLRLVSDRTYLHGFAATGKIEAARVFLAHGADVNAGDSQGATPLFMAAWQKQAAMVAYLLEAGADPTVTVTLDGNPGVLQFVDRSAQPETYALLEKAIELRKDSFGAWARAVASGDVAGMKQVLAIHPEYAKQPFKNGGWPLYNAIATSKIDAVTFLLDAGADPNSVEKENGAVPLHMALATSNFEIAGLLMDRGADPNQALVTAAGDCRVEMLELLLAHEVDVNFRVEGVTALDHAHLAGLDQCVRIQKKHGPKRGRDLK